MKTLSIYFDENLIHKIDNFRGLFLDDKSKSMARGKVIEAGIRFLIEQSPHSLLGILRAIPGYNEVKVQ